MSIRIRVNAASLAAAAGEAAAPCWLLIPRPGVNNIATLVEYCLKQLQVHHEPSSIRVFLEDALVPNHQPADILRDGDTIQLSHEPTYGHPDKGADCSTQRPDEAIKYASNGLVGIKRRRQVPDDVKHTTKHSKQRAQSITSSSSSSSSDSGKHSTHHVHPLPRKMEQRETGVTLVDAAPTSNEPVEQWKKTRRGKRAGKKHRKGGVLAHGSHEEGSGPAAGTLVPAQSVTISRQVEPPASQFVSLEGNWDHLVCGSTLREQLHAHDIICYTALRLSDRCTPEVSDEVIARIEDVDREPGEVTTRVVQVAGPLLGIANPTITSIELSCIMSCKKLISKEVDDTTHQAAPAYTPTSPLGAVPAGPAVTHLDITRLDIDHSSAELESATSATRITADSSQANTSTFTSSNKREVRNHILKRRLGVGSLLAALNKPINP